MKFATYLRQILGEIDLVAQWGHSAYRWSFQLRSSSLYCKLYGEDNLFLQNAKVSTTSWGVPELSFHRLPDCSDTAIKFVQTGISGGWSEFWWFAKSIILKLSKTSRLLSLIVLSLVFERVWVAFLVFFNSSHSLWGLRGYSGSYVEANAFDGDANTPWVSSCSSCAIGEALIGIVGVFLATNQTLRSTLKVWTRQMAAVACRRDSKVQSRGGPLRQAAAMHCGTRRLWLSADGLTNAACVAACKGTRSEQSKEFERVIQKEQL